MNSKIELKPADGKLGVLVPGLGAVTTTFIAGLEALNKGLYQPFGSVTQMGHIRLGRRDEGRQPLLREVLPMVAPKDLVVGAWDIYPDNAYEAAVKAGVLRPEQLAPMKDAMSAIEPMTAVFDRSFVKNIDGPNVKTGASLMDKAEALREDIRSFRSTHGLERVIMIWTASTEAYKELGPTHQSLEAFEAGLRESDPTIAPSMVYAWAALKEGVPYVNGAPHFTTDIPALMELAKASNIPLAGKDYKTGQTLMKTIIAPGLKARMLGLSGWFSTNILGNRDGEVLDDPESFKSKEVSKLSVLDTILQPDIYPSLYGDSYHKVRINYYPPHGDNKEGWDNIDIFGWMGMPMQIKVNFLCRDSILAAPLMLDLALFMDVAQRAGMGGIQEWLSFFFKSPMTAPSVYPEHDLFIQQTKLKNTIRYILGEELITHLGVEYYDYFE